MIAFNAAWLHHPPHRAAVERLHPEKMVSKGIRMSRTVLAFRLQTLSLKKMFLLRSLYGYILFRVFLQWNLNPKGEKRIWWRGSWPSTIARQMSLGRKDVLVDSLVRVGTVLEQDDINSCASLWISASPKSLKPMVFQIWSQLWTHCCDFLGEIIQKLRIRDECTGPTLLKPWLQSFLWRKGLVAKLGPYQDPVCSGFTIWNRVAFSHQIHPLPTSINS